MRTLWEITQTVMLSAMLFAAINVTTTRILVQSVSMQPTLYERDRVLVNKLAYKIGKPNRKDVIVFNPPVSNIDEPYIKRVIGLPGDVVRITNEQVYVNDLPLQETYIAAPPNYVGSWSVPPGHVFVLGDNRNNSYDSHFWGVVALEFDPRQSGVCVLAVLASEDVEPGERLRGGRSKPLGLSLNPALLVIPFWR